MRRLLFAAALVLGLVGSAAADLGIHTAAFNNQASNNLEARALRFAQADGPVIEVPRRVDTEQETVDFTGRVEAAGEVTLTVNGTPVSVAEDGSFRIRRQVPVGRSRLRLVAADSSGNQVEKRVFVRRAMAPAVAGNIDFGTYHALIIGNNEYNELKDLKTAVGDAEGVAEVLAARYGFEVELLVNATRYDIISALGALRAALTEGDNLLIYYAGHGNLDVDSDEGYWMPVDSEPDNVANWLSNATITSQLKAMRAKHVMVVSDSCYSGRLTREAQGKLKTGAERTAWLKRMSAKRSRTALTSGGLEPVLDTGGGGHSVFAQAFLDVLKTNAEVLDGQSLFDAVKRPVVLNADQTPEYGDIRMADHAGGDFLFVPVAVTFPVAVEAQSPPATESAESAQQETLFWQSIKDSDDPAMFDAYLQQFPSGTFAGLAKLKRDALSAPSGTAETRMALVVPPPEPVIEIAAMDATFVALKESNVRAEPTSESGRVGRLARDSPIIVTGKVTNKDWYRIDYEGRTGYIFGELIAEIDTGELAAWRKIAGSTDYDDFENFLEAYPDGHFAVRAEATIAALPTVSAEATEMAFWESIKDSDEPADYQAYLETYPDGRFATLARVRAKRMSSSPSTRVAALPSQQTEGVARRPGSGRLINVQPIRDIRGQDQPFLTNMLSNALQAVPNAVVVSEPPSGEHDVVVSGSILKSARRQEANPDYQAAQIAKSFFGGLAAIVGDVPQSYTIVDVEVLISARDTATGRSFAESGYANLKIDSGQVNPNQATFDALQTAVNQAAKRIVIRLSGGTPQQQVNADEIRNDPNLRKEIIRFYNKQRIWKSKGKKNRPTEMVKIYEINVASVSDNLIQLNVRYRWKLEGTGAGKSDRGVATVERVGSSFKVLDFQ